MFDPDYFSERDPAPSTGQHPRKRVWHSEAPSREEPRDRAKGSAARYKARIQSFVLDERPLPKVRHHALWLLHNCVAHPLLALGPTTYAMDFHELTSAWLNHKGQSVHHTMADTRGAKWLSYVLPKIKPHRRRYWVFHNVVAHALIGVAPTELTFKFHDWSANEMDVPGWV